MGFWENIRVNNIGKKAYGLHVAGMQLRRNGKYLESELRLDQAFKLYEEAYKLGYRKCNATQGYALLLMRKGEFERARELMLENSKNKAMTQDERFTLRMDYAVCMWKLGDIDKAVETARKAAAMKMNGGVYNTLGMFLVEQARQTGDFEEAMRFNNEAMDYDDEDAGVLDNVGQMYLAMSEKAKADGDQEKAKEYRTNAYKYLGKAWKNKPDQISSTYYYAKMLHEDGDDDKARKVMEAARKVPFSRMLQISEEQAKELIEAIGE